MKKLLITTLAVLGTCGLHANAAVYQCEQDGKVIFSQFPCDAEPVDVKKVSPTTGVIQQGGKPTDHQLETLRKRSRFLEYQLTQYEMQHIREVEALKNELYEARKKMQKSEVIASIKRKMERLDKDFQEKNQKQKEQLTAINQQLEVAERQYAAN